MKAIPSVRRVLLASMLLFSFPAASFCQSSEDEKSTSALPREVMIGTVSQEGLHARDPLQMHAMMLERAESLGAMKPDIVCFPETYAYMNLSQHITALPKVAVEHQERILTDCKEFAVRHHCYVVCSTLEVEQDSLYNAAILIDRSGNVVGSYRKQHATTDEMAQGVCAGPANPPVFETDFGKVGFQICFDIEWDDGWTKLEEKGAEIVFWPSAFAGGKLVGTKAWQHRYVVVSSTCKDTSRICDIDGETIAATSRWNYAVCDRVNLEKTFLPTWPYVMKFPAIQAKYGNKIRIKTYPEEEWSILESLSADVRIADVMNEFELRSLKDHLAIATEAQRENLHNQKQP